MLSLDIRGLHEAAYILALAAFGSQILALVRDRLFASQFGAGETLDIYYAAFRIPDILYVFIASFVATTVLIPFISERLIHNTKEEVAHFLNSVLVLL